MARARLLDTAVDLMSDPGAVLFSFIKGEALEYPITISFIVDAADGYTYEAVLLEANNVANQTSAPTTMRTGGVNTTLTVRVPTDRGVWSSSGVYNYEDVVLYNGLYYKLLDGTGYTSSVAPSSDTNWATTEKNKVYVQFPSTIASTWTVQPNIITAVYGYFELRVTEPNNSIFVRTWKPVRGLVEILFSPTDYL